MKAEESLGLGRKPIARWSVALAVLLALPLTFSGLFAGTLQLVSSHNPLSTAVPVYQNSVAPVVSPDGRYVLFVSSANNLTVGDNAQTGTDIFLRDRLAATTTLVSVNMNGTGGGNGNSGNASLSPDGRYVLFESDSSDLVAGDTNNASDIFLRDLMAGTTTLISVSTNGGFGNGASSDPVMTPDGRYVAFLSAANNLVTNDTNGIADVFVRDVLAGTTTLVSGGAVGPISSSAVAMASPVITPDGRFVAFVSAATGLTGGVATPPLGNVYVRDLLSGSTIWAGTNLYATYGSNVVLSTHPSISDDGRFVAFKYGSRVFRFDSANSSNTLVTASSLASSGSSLVDDILGPEMTPDGRFISYVSNMTITPFAYRSLWLWDAQTLSNSAVSQNILGGVLGSSFSDTPVLSPDGRFVAFLSSATNLVSNTITGGSHVYLRDMQLGSTRLIDLDTNGNGSSDALGTVPSLSPDGRYVAFAAGDGALVAGDTNLALDVFLRDTTGSSTELSSLRNPAVISQSGGGISSMTQFAVTPNGRWLVFTSRADDLVTNDFNNDQDVFVRDLQAGSTTLVSVATNGTSAAGGASGNPLLSADGRYVAFTSAATNLVANDTNGAVDIFLRDLQAGTTVLVNVDSNGVVLGNGDSSSPAMSQDGRYITFLCKTNFTAQNTCSYLRDTVAGVTTLFTENSITGGTTISADGRYVGVNFVLGPSLRIWDAQASAYVFSNTSLGPIFSPTGTRILYTLSGSAVVTDFATKSNLYTASSTPFQSTRFSPQPWSVDGRFIVFATSAALLAADNNNSNDVYLHDLQTDTTTLVSINSNFVAAANGDSEFPAISGDGRFVVFRSFATDLVPGITNVPNLFLFDRFTGSNTLLGADSQPTFGWSQWISRPAINGDGRVLGFYSWRSGLVTGDLNPFADVFATTLSPWGDTDNDLDGIPDAWLTHYFGHANGQAGDLSRAQDDADGDGMNNLQEFLAGTDPTSAASVLKMKINAVIAAGSVSLTWGTIPGKSYTVQYKGEFDDPQWQDLGGNVSVVGNQGSASTALVVPKRYYRVVAVN